MYIKYVLSAAAAASLAKAQAICSSATATINSAAEATDLASCETVKGTVLINSNTGQGSVIDISGPSEIEGDVVASNNGGMTSFKSSTLTTIGGAFRLTNLTALSTLSFASLKTVDSITWITLPALDALDFGTPGITRATTVEISDTFLSSLGGLDLTSVATMNINNNRRLVEFSSGLGNLTDSLNIQANGLNLAIFMHNLTWIANMTIANVTKFEVPNLKVVNGSMRFDSNYFESFSAPNLTSTEQGDISFVSNSALTNISMPALKTVGGGLTIANNTELEELNGFPELKMVGGAVKIRGSFTEVSMPALNDVKGAFDISSTADIDASCTELEKLKGNQVQGKFSCTGNNANANNDTSSAGNSSSSNKEDAAGSFGVNSATVVGLAAAAGILQLLL